MQPTEFLKKKSRRLMGVCTLFMLSACGEYVIVSKDGSEQLIEGQRLRYYAKDAQAESLLGQAYRSSDPMVKAEAAFQLAELAEKRQKHDEALAYLEEAFKAGYLGSEVRLAKAYLNASPSLRNYDIAENILQAHRHESTDVALTLAKLYMAKEQYAKAMPPLESAEAMYRHSVNLSGDALQIARVYRDLHYAGAPVPDAKAKARQWYLTAQEKGNEQEAPVELAKLQLLDAPADSPEFHEAVSMLQIAAAKNNPEAMEKLGQAYHEAGDNEKALSWLTRSERLGDPYGTSAYSLAKLYRSTREQPGHQELMQAWYRTAIDKGNLEAKQSWHAYQAQEREKEIARQQKLQEKQIREAQKARMRQMATLSPEAKAAFSLLGDKGDKDGAYKEFKRLADSGTSLHAMLMVDGWDGRKKIPAYHPVYRDLDKRKLVSAIIENEGQLGEPHKAMIVNQWQLAARYGPGDAAYHLAKYYENTHPGLARQWMDKAVAMGNGKALIHKAREIAVNGKGEQDAEQQLFSLYQKAAEAGEAEGQYQTGLMYAEGKGVAKNQQKAKYWLNEAKKSGYNLASDVTNTP